MEGATGDKVTKSERGILKHNDNDIEKVKGSCSLQYLPVTFHLQKIGQQVKCAAANSHDIYNSSVLPSEVFIYLNRVDSGTLPKHCVAAMKITVHHFLK